MKKRILVVEDEEKLRRVLELQLIVRRLRRGQGRPPPKRACKLVDRADLVLTDLQAAAAWTAWNCWR